uniref:Uncharacterized protein n=1 Tax=Meloidogyne hapla TaxID=6305 RepID=A0A1I8BS22_MELHA
MTRYRRTGSIHPRSLQLSPIITKTKISSLNSINSIKKEENKEIFKYSNPSAFKRISFNKEINSELNQNLNNYFCNKEINNQKGKQLIEQQKTKHYLIERLIE